MISIIIVNYNGKNTLLNCIDSLKKQDFPKNKYEIIVVDNNSSDESYKLLEHDPEVKLIKSKENLGFAKGNNLAIEHAKGDYIAFLNNDATADQNWLKELYNSIQPKEIAAVTNIVYYANTNIPWFSGAKIYPLNFVKHNYLKLKEGFSDYPCGCSFLIKKSVIKELGYLFDEKLFMYAEDNDLGIRIRKLGYKIAYTPKAIAYHNIPLKRLSKNEIYSTFKNRTYLLKKHSKLPLPIFLILDFLVYFPVYLIYKILRKPKILKFIPIIFKARIDSYKLLK